MRGLLGWGLETREQIRGYQNRQLRALIEHAYERVPYYRRLFDAARVSPKEIRDVGDLARIPTTARSDIQVLPAHDVCARGAAFRPNRIVRTSGSSGAPLTVYRRMAEERLMLAYRAKAVGAWGFGARARRANIDHLSPDVVESEAAPHFYERLGIMPRLNLDWRLAKDEIVAKVSAFDADLISGPPSLLAELADELDDRDRARLRAKRVLTGAEQLTDAVRDRIARGFERPVTDLYGCHEVVFIAMEAPGVAGYRVCEESVVVEVLKGDKRARHGEIVLTGLHLWTMPFIRYRLGDFVEVADDTGPRLLLRSIDGRVTDRFTLPGGRRVHGYTLGEVVESSDLAVRRFQIVQEQRDVFRVRLVCDGGESLDFVRLRECLRAKLGADISVEVERVSSIDRPSRKFHTFVSLERGQSP